jgi:DNA (cytosine-5)-methyltransferase 1
MNKQKKLTFIDLFAGCGGLSEGFLQSGKYEGLAHVEWELPMVNTLRHRLVNRWEHTNEDALKRVIHFDIQKTKELIFGKWSEETAETYGLTNHTIIKNKGLKGLIGRDKVDLIIGGPPCQAYSIAGRAQDKNSMKDDYRNYLFESFVEVVKYFQPKMFVFENVPGMLSAAPGGVPVTHRIYKSFNAIDYEIKAPEELKSVVLDASLFCVPQKRKRVILIGIKKNSDFNLNDVYSEILKLTNEKKIPTVKNAIGKLPPLFPLEVSEKQDGKNISHSTTVKKLLHHEPRYHNQRDIKIFKKWIAEGMNNRTTAEKINFYNGLMHKQSNHAKYRNLEWDKPSPTIVAHLYKDGLMFIHPDEQQARSISVREAAALQSFPDDFTFLGSSAYQFKMIGNAVPVRLAESIAEGIGKYFSSKM